MKIKHIGISLVIVLFFITGSIAQSGVGDIKSGNIEYELVNDWPQLSEGNALGQPTGIGIDKKGNIFVFHRAGRRWTEPFPDTLISENTILELDSKTGKILNSWGANYFIMPHGLAIDGEDNIRVTDVGLHQVFKFNHDGLLLMKLGIAKVPGNDSLHFNLPTDVAIANDGSFYVGDGYGNSRIVKFSSSGKYLMEWGTKGKEDGEFNIPHSLSLDDNGNVYVADRENNRIQIFDSNGVFLKQLQNNEKVAQLPAITIDYKQNLLAVDYDFTSLGVNGSTIFQYDTNDKIVYQFGGIETSKRSKSWYHDISVDRDGNIYVGDIYANKVRKFRLKTYFPDGNEDK